MNISVPFYQNIIQCHSHFIVSVLSFSVCELIQTTCWLCDTERTHTRNPDSKFLELWMATLLPHSYTLVQHNWNVISDTAHWARRQYFSLCACIVFIKCDTINIQYILYITHYILYTIYTVIYIYKYIHTFGHCELTVCGRLRKCCTHDRTTSSDFELCFFCVCVTILSLCIYCEQHHRIYILYIIYEIICINIVTFTIAFLHLFCDYVQWPLINNLGTGIRVFSSTIIKN